MFHTAANTSFEEIQQRIERLQIALQESGVDGALIFQKTDLYYFSGTIQQASLYIPADGNPVLMVRKNPERARAESPLQKQIAVDSLAQMTGALACHDVSVPRRLGLELDVIPARLYLALGEVFPDTRRLDVSDVIRTIRSVKSDTEIALIREAATGADQVAAFAAEAIREGISEIELAGIVEAEARRLGHQGFVRMRLWDHEMFYGHLMSGARAAVPSYLASPTGGAALSPAVAQGSSHHPIQPREPILVDYVFAKNGYLADHTRIFAIGGLAPDLMAAHRAALEIQESLKQEIRPGVPAGRIYELALSLAADRGYSDHFMGADEPRVRFVGHGIGLELDEYPFLAQGQETLFQAGMVIALEPKMIFPGRGVVGIENTHLVTESGAEQLTRFEEEVIIV
jgi:Xaa-Pro aminopeptidase